MKFLLVVFAVLFAVQARYLSDQEAWEQFKIQHGKTYRSLSEDQQRFSIFKSNLRSIEEHNERYARGKESFSMKINQFGDMTKEEFKKTLGLQIPKHDEKVTMFKGDSNAPESIDWRKKGAVTAVRNQESCGSCWAFSSVGAIEGQLFIHRKVLRSLSPQNLVDCSKGIYYCHGCIGGYQTEAFKYVRDHGILSDKQYPYTATNGTCLKRGGVKISGYEAIPQGNETALTQAIGTKGPVSVCLDMAGLQFYQTGVMDSSHCSSAPENLNHAILLVGYEKDYYIGKNSWGPDWGEQGFVKILRNNNTCGISLLNSYPVL